MTIMMQLCFSYCSQLIMKIDNYIENFLCLALTLRKIE